MKIADIDLEFRLQRTDRRTMEISVEPSGSITVTAPTAASEELIFSGVRRRVSWIRRQQKIFGGLPLAPLPRRWVSGETHRYLGRQYRLRILTGQRVSVRLSGRFFVVTLPRPDDSRAVCRAMANWYRSHAVELLAERVERAIRATTWLGIDRSPSVTIRRMKKRWGSATPIGGLYFNVDLVKLPLGCIDYVVMHELAHLRHPNHGRAFWQLLGRCMPDCDKQKKRLQLEER